MNNTSNQPQIKHQGQPSGPALVLEVANSPGHPRNSEAAFITLKDGTIKLVYSHFLGQRGSDFEPSHLASRVSVDAGFTWSSNSETLFEREGKINDMSASLLRLHDGRIVLFNLRKNSKNDCLLYMRTSDDETHTWSAPSCCMPGQQGYFVVVNDRVIQTRSGRLIAPAAMHAGPDGPLDMLGKIICFLSDDAGLTWRKSQSTMLGLVDLDGQKQQYKTQEPGVIELTDGRIMMWVRTDTGFQHAAFSSDGAETFTPFAPTAIQSPRSPATIKTIPGTADLLLVHNPITDNLIGGAGSRAKLAIAISKDQGKTWSNSKTLEDSPGDGFSYPAINFASDRVLLSYGCSLDGRNLISQKVISIPLDWLYH